MLSRIIGAGTVWVLQVTDQVAETHKSSGALLNH